MSAYKLFIGTLQGGTGIPFDDTPSDPHNSYITKILIHYDSDIEALEVGYYAIPYLTLFLLKLTVPPGYLLRR